MITGLGPSCPFGVSNSWSTFVNEEFKFKLKTNGISEVVETNRDDKSTILVVFSPREISTVFLKGEADAIFALNDSL